MYKPRHQGHLRWLEQVGVTPHPPIRHKTTRSTPWCSAMKQHGVCQLPPQQHYNAFRTLLLLGCVLMTTSPLLCPIFTDFQFSTIFSAKSHSSVSYIDIVSQLQSPFTSSSSAGTEQGPSSRSLVRPQHLAARTVTVTLSQVAQRSYHHPRYEYETVRTFPVCSVPDGKDRPETVIAR